MNLRMVQKFLKRTPIGWSITGFDNYICLTSYGVQSNLGSQNSKAFALRLNVRSAKLLLAQAGRQN